ncbi:phosphotransferase [Algoriphagus litoralis]|uniref:phosphotransferase n=1 Tax=Algoriphagus litoralis TaxID=2202829 RepID=UPI000DB9A8BD|nr:phosphotransferase [Algoriphagus litoralis]
MTELNENSGIAELQKLPFWNPEEILLSVEPAGESNMNLVLRIKTNTRNLILKQSKPYVRKYPQIPAPIERIEVEHQFLQLISSDEVLANQAPTVIHFEQKEHMLITGDLGKSADFSRIYSGNASLEAAHIRELTKFLNRLHKLNAGGFPDNMAMRRLNHEHIFHFPFLLDNGFDLDQVQAGLQEISLVYKKDEILKSEIEKLGIRYLSRGSSLLHGDYYPGSWLDTPSGVKVIDPEFGFLGDPEFDLGVFLAHLDLGRQEEKLKALVLENYTNPVDKKLVNQYRGVEILRRLIGIAQLPVHFSLEGKSELMESAKNFILN